MTDDDDRTLIRPLATQVMPPPPPVPDNDMGSGLPVGTRLGEFELTGVVGVGGFGIVYLAYDHSLGRKVALKEYMPSVLAARVGPTQVQVKSERHRDTFEAGRKSFINEARLLAQFDHPSLVKVYRFWEANGTAYMVMPYYEGKTLKDQLREMDGPPSEAWLRTLLYPLTEALMVLHAEHCYHRDIAPDNVMMLAGSQRPVLLDFGAARRVIGDMTQALTVILKPGFAPLEQYAEIPGMKQDGRTDVYALAAVVHYAITGRTPPPSVGRLVGDSYVPLLQAAAGRYSPAFLAAVDHGLAVKPEDRTASVAQFRAEMGLEAATSPAAPGTSAMASVTGHGAAAAEGGRGRGPALAIAAAVAVGVLGVAAYLMLGKSPAPPVASSTPAPAATPAATRPEAVAPAVAASGTESAPPMAAPAPLAPGPLDMAAAYERVVQAQTPDFKVTAVPNKTALRIGHDELSFTVTSQREGYLYVQLYGADGETMLLYPNGTAGQQKLRPGQPLKLPKPPIVFQSVGPTGPNLLLVMVSARERDFSALQPRSDGPYRILPSGEQAQRIAASLPPSRVPAQAGVPICPAGGCADDYGAAIMRVEVVN